MLYASQSSRLAMFWAQARPKYIVPPKERPEALMGLRVPGTMPMLQKSEMLPAR